MNSIRLLVCITVFTATAGVSAKQCEKLGGKKQNLLEGEAHYYIPYFMKNINATEDQFSWYRNEVVVSSDESKRIHTHGFDIYFLNVTPDDAAVYTFEYTNLLGNCYAINLTVEVFDESFRLLEVIRYGDKVSTSQSSRISCPVQHMCKKRVGEITWYKNMDLIKGEHEVNLRLEKSSKHHEGVYSCMCTWEHNHRSYNTSGSVMLTVEVPNDSRLLLLSPSDKDQFADAGSTINLTCSASCWINIKNQCVARWEVNGSSIDNIKGYDQVISSHNEPYTNNTIAIAVLKIQKVSAEDFQRTFYCVIQNKYDRHTVAFNLKPKQSIIPVVIGCLVMFLICIVGAVVIKMFLVDLALFFRPHFLLSSAKDSKKAYDAYVIYQLQSDNITTENLLSEFVSGFLPTVLEERCGYKLFIQGRDDTPGEDHLELVEKRIKDSRRLMVILTSASGSESSQSVSPHETTVGGFDWQVGIHYALVQREMSVILVQLGDTGPQGYSHLPAGLQHLIQKSAPIKWQEKAKNALKSNSHFWKRVRYLMPARPVANHMRLADVETGHLIYCANGRSL